MGSGGEGGEPIGEHLGAEVGIGEPVGSMGVGVGWGSPWEVWGSRGRMGELGRDADCWDGGAPGPWGLGLLGGPRGTLAGTEARSQGPGVPSHPAPGPCSHRVASAW